MKNYFYEWSCEYDKYKRDKSRVNDWKYRVLIESLCHDQNCFVTLTYNDENLPYGGNLSLRDYQCFLKSLRASIYPQRIRYFGCGEYGSHGFRPHYHIILFGFCPNDLIPLCFDKKNNQIYRSEFIESIWNKGYVSVGIHLDTSSIPYLCKYLQKFNCYDNLVKPFITMSRRPGIGYNALSSGLVDIDTDKLYLDGRSIRIPRYYLNKLKEFELSEERLIEDIDGSLEFYIPSNHSDIENTLNNVSTRVDSILLKRRQFWETRFDNEQYVSNVKKFKKFSTERDVVRSKDASASRDRRDGI